MAIILHPPNYEQFKETRGHPPSSDGECILRVFVTSQVGTSSWHGACVLYVAAHVTTRQATLIRPKSPIAGHGGKNIS